MKKFTSEEIVIVDTEPIVGGRMGDWLRQLMKNQNEIIELLSKEKEVEDPRITASDAESLLLLLLQVEIGRFLSADAALDLLNKLQAIKKAGRR